MEQYEKKFQQFLNEGIKDIPNPVYYIQAKKMVKKIRNYISRLESLPEYQEVKNQYENGELALRKFQDYVRKQLMTKEEREFFGEFSRRIRYGERAPYNLLSDSNIPKEIYDAGIDLYALAKISNARGRQDAERVASKAKYTF